MPRYRPRMRPGRAPGKAAHEKRRPPTRDGPSSEFTIRTAPDSRGGGARQGGQLALDPDHLGRLAHGHGAEFDERLAELPRRRQLVRRRPRAAGHRHHPPAAPAEGRPRAKSTSTTVTPVPPRPAARPWKPSVSSFMT